MLFITNSLGIPHFPSVSCSSTVEAWRLPVFGMSRRCSYFPQTHLKSYYMYPRGPHTCDYCFLSTVCKLGAYRLNLAYNVFVVSCSVLNQTKSLNLNAFRQEHLLSVLTLSTELLLSYIRPLLFTTSLIPKGI